MAKEKTDAKRTHLLTSQGQRIMLICIVVCVTVCAMLFTFLGVHMVKNSGSAIDNIGEKTMRETNYQFTKRFETVMEQRLEMARALDRVYDPTDSSSLSVIASDALARGFKYLAFMRVNEENINDAAKGITIEFLLGEFSVTDFVPFRESVVIGEEKIAVGRQVTVKDANSDGLGEEIVLFSVPTSKYTMQNGQKSMSLVVGISNLQFVEMLNVDTGVERGSHVNIIRKDNSFVLKSDFAADYNNFTDLLTEKYSLADNINIEKVIKDLLDGMKTAGALDDANQTGQNAVYSNIFHVGERHIYMYCNKLDKSEWFLVSLTDNAELNAIVEDLNNQWVVMIVVAVVSIVVMLMIVFVIYYYFNKQMLTQLENAKFEALDASKAKSEFLSNMSHDIRTPMNAIVGMTAIARANIDNAEQVGNCLKKIALSSKHLLGLINDVLDMSKIESGKMTLNMEQISLREVLDGITTIVQPQIKTKHQNFNVVIRNVEQENVYCDSVRLNQVLLNLLSNAIKFTSEEGTIEIYLDQEASPIGEDYVRTHIRVKDNGIGMSDEFQKKIFESFSREDNKRVHHTEGSGLGMAITKYIVDAMKGTIELKSELGMGTQFHITLDLERAIVTEEEMILPNWKMLIVDDDHDLCETTVVALKEIGIDADYTLDGESAVDIAVKANNTKNRYDIILLDWKLPGIDGVETAKRIHKQLGDNNVPILLISAYDWSEIETAARAAGISGFISKPLFKSTLFYGLKSFAGEKDITGSAAEESVKKDDLKGLHVLLAEDNELNWEIAETLLDSVGITCDHAENGQMCVDMFKKSKPGTYKAILMDLRMPIMNGYEATTEIRKLDHPDKDLPIVAMTADAFADDMKKCLDCGMNAHIAKPIDIDVVQNTLSKFIKK